MSASQSSPTDLEYFVVDAFTDTALVGNPVAVVIDSAGLSTESMQAVAREFGGRGEVRMRVAHAPVPCSPVPDSSAPGNFTPPAVRSSAS